MPEFSFASLRPLLTNTKGPFFQKNVLVLGAKGLSGNAAARLLLCCGARILLVDRKGGAFSPFLEYAIEKKSAHFCEEGKVARFLSETDLLVAAPGISPKHPLLAAAKEMGISIRGELDLAYEILRKVLEQNPPPVIAITGTDGKSTVTALLCHLINQASTHHALAAGNFGLPLSVVALAFFIQKKSHKIANDQLRKNNTKILEQIPFQSPLEKKEQFLFSTEEKKVFEEIRAHANNLILVIENSSFQLELVESYHPQVALLLNLAEDHLDRYEGKMESYLAAKLGMLKNMQKDDVFLCTPKLLKKIEKKSPLLCRSHAIALPPSKNSTLLPEIRWKGSFLLSASEFSQPGKHNRLNLEFALAALSELQNRLTRPPFGTDLKIAKDSLATAIRSFRGLPHRLELVGQIPVTLQQNSPRVKSTKDTIPKQMEQENNISLLSFVNDSKATTVHALLSAIECYKGYKIFLLIGGRAKDTDFSPLKEHKSQVAFFAFGEAKEELSKVLDTKEHYPDLKAAFRAALSEAQNYLKAPPAKKAVILLSPACASYDAYKNYQERGEHFRKLVLDFLEHARPSFPG